MKQPKLCSSDFWDERGGQLSYGNMQDSFHEQIGVRYGLERGEVGSNKKHTTKYQWQKAQQEAELANLEADKAHAEELIQEAQTAVATRDKALEELKPLQGYLRKDAEAKTKKELKENLREIETSEERIDKLDKIIESLYEDKVTGKISEERYLKMSDTYEAKQATLKERVKTLKAEIEKAKAQDDKILDFMLLIYKYSNFEELTPEILRSFIDKVIVHEKTKVNGHYRQTVEIVYNFVGAIVPTFFDDDEDY